MWTVKVDLAEFGVFQPVRSPLALGCHCQLLIADIVATFV